MNSPSQPGFLRTWWRRQESDLSAQGWLLMLVLQAPVNLLGILFGGLLPANPDLYLDNIVLARKAPAQAR